MPPRCKRSVLRLGAAACAIVVTASTVVASTSTTATASSAVVYDAVGDSYTAQDSLVVWNEKPCEVAPTTYPSLAASDLRLSETNLACSGADSANLLDLAQPGDAAPQLELTSTDAGLITILIGLNDLGAPPYYFVNELAGCEKYNAEHTTDVSCQHLPGMGRRAMLRAVRSVSTDLVAALAWLQANRPAAKVFVLDYPAIVGTPSCAGQPLTASDVALVNVVMAKMQRVLRQDARRDGAGFIDLYGPSLNAAGCAAWVAPGTATGGVLVNHPTQAGVRSMATVVEKALAGYLLSH